MARTDRALTRGLAAAAAALVLLAAPAGASAEAVTGTELRALAARAAADPQALARLRGIDRVDGAPADLRAVTDGVSGADLRARLDALVADPGTTRGGDDAAAAARRITGEGRFAPLPTERVDGEDGDDDDGSGDRLLGLDLDGSGTALAILAVVALAAGAAGAQRTMLRRTRTGRTVAAGRPEAPAGAADLERDAERAAREGDHRGAVRLRFRAGLLRLAERRTLDGRTSLTTGQASRALRSPTFDALAADHDAVLYGGREAGPEESGRARDGWAALLREPRR